MTDSKSEAYHGSCHCGNLKFTASPKRVPESVYECNCSYCRLTGFQYASSLPIYESSVAVGKIEETSDWAQATDYMFGKKTVAHKFCSRCGSSVAIFENGAPLSVNVRMMYDDIPPRSLPIKIRDGATLEKDYEPPAKEAPEQLGDGRWRYSGGCHCGAVKYQVDSEEITSANDCSCTICWRNADLWRYPMKPDISITAGEENLSVYRWGSKGAGHAFCKTCGVKLFNMLADNAPLLPINVRTVPSLDVYGIARKPQMVQIELPDGNVMEKTMDNARDR